MLEAEETLWSRGCDEWNLGKTPVVDFSFRHRFPFGGIELCLTLREAVIEKAEVFTDAMDGDLNTSMAVTALYDVLKAKTNDATKLALIEDFDRVLALDLLKAAEALRREAPARAEGNDDLTKKIEEMIARRADAKKAKNYAEADAIRAELTAMGVTLIDTKDGTQYTIG